MKISEMIQHLTELQNEFGDKEMVLSVTDHTDWTYNFHFPSFELDEVYDTDSDDEDEHLEGEYFVCSISI
jgi:hypothetical protein